MSMLASTQLLKLYSIRLNMCNALWANTPTLLPHANHTFIVTVTMPTIRTGPMGNHNGSICLPENTSVPILHSLFVLFKFSSN